MFLGVIPVDETISISYIDHFTAPKTFVAMTFLRGRQGWGSGG
jgi:hypothetical protein